MDLEGQSESSNVEDRRSSGPAVAAGGGLVTLVAVAVAYFLGIDPNQAKRVLDKVGAGRMGEQQRQGPPTEDEHYHFARKVLGSTEEVWDHYFDSNYHKRYEHPGMVLFSQSVDSGGCGTAPSAVGPFYCPVSRRVFLDPTFFDDLEKKLGGSKADASRAYVVAHEVGHHVQNLLGYNRRVEDFQSREGDNAGIRLELQADYLAGVWGHEAAKAHPKLFNKSDMDSIIQTAQAIGDNRIQKRMQGWTSPEKYTHGTDRQRLNSFMQGFESGDASKSRLDQFFDPNTSPLNLEK